MILWFYVLIFGSITVLEVSAHFVKSALRSLLLLGDFAYGAVTPRNQEMLVPLLFPSYQNASLSVVLTSLFSPPKTTVLGLNQRLLVFSRSNDTSEICLYEISFTFMMMMMMAAILVLKIQMRKVDLRG